jgi:rhodanese-related sulfurtransferase
MNIQGYESIGDIIERGEKPLDPNTSEAVANATMALILDTREAKDFHKPFIPNSINIGLDNNFAQWVGELIPDIKQQILLVIDLGNEEESIIRLARVGCYHLIGYRKGGIKSWDDSGKKLIISIDLRFQN